MANTNHAQTKSLIVDASSTMINGPSAALTLAKRVSTAQPEYGMIFIPSLTGNELFMVTSPGNVTVSTMEEWELRPQYTKGGNLKEPKKWDTMDIEDFADFDDH